MNDPANSSDEELANSLSDSDDQAFAALVQRHARSVYDFSIRLTLDSESAAEITRGTFGYLSEQAGLRPDGLSLRAWLLNYALERGLEALNGERPGAAKLSSGDRRFTQAEASIDREAALWAWQAARSLRPRDYGVLDMAMRRGIDPEEFRGSAAQGRGGARTILSRASEAFAEAYMATALYFRGRETCNDLAELVGGGAAGMRVGIRRQIASHVEDCATCQSTLESLPGAEDVFKTLQDIEPPPDPPQQITSRALAGGAAAAAAQLILDDAPAEIEADETLEADEPAPEFEEPVEEVSAGQEEYSSEENGASLPASPASEEELWARPEGMQEFAGVASTDLPEAISSLEERYGVEPVAQSYGQPEVYEQDGTEYEAGPYYGGGYSPAPLTLSERLSAWFAPAYDRSFVLSYALLGVATAVAVYVGIALATSLGGGDSPSIGADAVREIACETGPLSLEAGSTRQIAFDPTALNGFTLDTVVVTDRPAAVDSDALTVQPSGPTALTARAASVVSPAARNDAYVLQILWVRGSEDAVSDCPLIVNVPASTSFSPAKP